MNGRVIPVNGMSFRLPAAMMNACVPMTSARPAARSDRNSSASAADEFRSLLAAGLALVIGTQAFIIAAGNLKLIPLTGITLPFISYGGSSLLVNGIIVGLLLALSDRGVEPPPPPRRPGRLARLAGRGRSLAGRSLAVGS